MPHEKSPSGLTRRSFLKTTAAVAGTVALGSSFGCSLGPAQEAASGEEQIYACTCAGNCQGKLCPLDVVVRDGKAVNINKFSGDTRFEYLCPKGYMNLERMYSPLRVKYPLKRTGPRGSNEWERISWDEAIDEICSKWKDIRSKYGDDSLLFIRGVATNLSLAGWYPDRLKAYLGASSIPLIYDMNGLVTIPKYSGSTAGNAFVDVPNAKNIFVWGANPSESGTIIFHYLTEAKALGAHITVIDPTFTITASKANEWIPIRPGTDGLLAIGLMKIALRDGLVDEEFLQSKSQAPFLVKEADGLFLRLSDLGKAEASSKEDQILVHASAGEVGTAVEIPNPLIEGSFTVEGNKVSTAFSLLIKRLDEWTLDQIATLTDIPLETIESLAKRFASGPSTIVTGFGIDHYANGHTGYANIMALLAVFGQIGKPGTGLETVSCSVPVAAGPFPYLIASPLDAPPSPPVYVPNLYDVAKGTASGGYTPNLKAAYMVATNPIGNMPDRKKQIEAFDSLELVVVSDIFMSETARYADIVLPVSFIFESPSVAYMGSPYVNIIEQAVPPAFESKSDFEITTLLGRGMGLGDKFTMTVEEYIEACLDNEAARALGVTWERLKKEKRIWSYPSDGQIYGQNGFLTPSGKYEFYFENSKPMLDYGQSWDPLYESLPYWEPPLEAWSENKLFTKYPLIFTSERAKFKTHTMFTHVPSLLEIEPEPTVQINPDDAHERGIKHGDITKIFNDRGYVVIKAIFNPGIRKGMLVMDHGWEGDQFIDGHYNDLSSRASNRVIPNANFFDCLCEIEKAG